VRSFRCSIAGALIVNIAPKHSCVTLLAAGFLGRGSSCGRFRCHRFLAAGFFAGASWQRRFQASFFASGALGLPEAFLAGAFFAGPSQPLWPLFRSGVLRTACQILPRGFGLRHASEASRCLRSCPARAVAAYFFTSRRAGGQLAAYCSRSNFVSDLVGRFTSSIRRSQRVLAASTTDSARGHLAHAGSSPHHHCRCLNHAPVPWPCRQMADFRKQDRSVFWTHTSRNKRRRPNSSDHPYQT